MKKSKTQRQTEMKSIIMKLSELNLTMKSDAVQALYVLMQKYVNHGERLEVNILLLERQQVIKGMLEPEVGTQTWVKLESY